MTGACVEQAPATRFLALFACDHKLIVHAEDAWNHVGTHSSHGEVAFVVDHACEGHVAVIHDDVNGMPADRRIVGDAASLASDAFAAATRSFA